MSHEFNPQPELDQEAGEASPEESVEQVAKGLRALAGAGPPPAAQDWSAEIARQDLRAASYDDLYEVVKPCYRAYEDWVTEAVYSAWYEGRGRMLVVGCGTGALLQRLQQRMPSRLLTALDVSPAMARAARLKLPGVPEIRGCAFDSYRPVVPFDVVVLGGCLEAMPDLAAVANHTASLTLHGSRIVICVRNGDWLFADPAARQREQIRHPGWYWRRWLDARRASAAAAVEAAFASPHQPLTPARIRAAFEGRFGLRDERTGFGITRLFENVIAVPREQGLETVGQTRERRPWMGALDRLKKQDEAFAKREPMRGGLLAMLFDKLH